MMGRIARFCGYRIIDFFLPGGGLAMDCAEGCALVAVCSRLFCVVTLECFEKPTFIPCMSSCLVLEHIMW
jgi:hypothetical protein